MTDFGTSKSIPSATCVLQAVTLTPVDIKQEPTAGATKWGDLIPGQWMAVAGRTSDGWIAVHPTPASSLTIYDMVWVATSDLVQFQGPCNSLKTIHIDLPSSGCFVTGTPDIAIPTYDRPHDNSTPTGSLNTGTSYEIRGYTSTGWYGIYVGSPDVAPDRYGAYGLRWIKGSISLPPGPQCGTLPLIY
jgi:hypothetical protein